MKSINSTLMSILLAVTLVIGVTLKETRAAGAGEQVKEIMPGMLEGYLSKEEQLDSKAFVLPSPVCTA